MIVLDNLWKKAQYNDAYSWQKEFKQLEKNWLDPFFTALQKGEINKLTLTSLNKNAIRNFTLSRKNLWKFWRVTRPLSIYA